MILLKSEELCITGKEEERGKKKHAVTYCEVKSKHRAVTAATAARTLAGDDRLVQFMCNRVQVVRKLC